jgi:hypothetical protein
MKPKKHIVLTWNAETDIVEPIGTKGRVILIGKKPVSKPARMPVKLSSKPQGALRPTKQTTEPVRQSRAPKRLLPVDPLVKLALEKGSMRFRYTLYLDHRTTPYEKRLLWLDLMQGMRTYIP